MPTYSVVTCSDTNMLPAACCALLSIAQNTLSTEITYYLVGIGLKAEDRQALEVFSQRHTIPIQIVEHTEPDNLRNTEGRWSQATLARLFIDQYLPSDQDIVLYVDADVIAASSVDALWSLNFGEDYLAAVEDYVMAFPEKAKRREARLKLRYGPAYFNAGILLFSWQRCLRDQLFVKCRDVLVDSAFQLESNDQDVLNIVFQGRWMRLDPKWNVQTGLLPLVTSPSILHFTGRRKPWQESRNWLHRAFSAHYSVMLDQTPWLNFSSKRSVSAEVRDFLLSIGAGLGNLRRQALARSYFERANRAATKDVKALDR